MLQTTYGDLISLSLLGLLLPFPTCKDGSVGGTGSRKWVSAGYAGNAPLLRLALLEWGNPGLILKSGTEARIE